MNLFYYFDFFICFLLLQIKKVSFKFAVDTRSGLVGLSVVNLVVQERNTVIVPEQIHGQHKEDEGVAALGQVKNHGLVTLSGAQVLVHAKKEC